MTDEPDNLILASQARRQGRRLGRVQGAMIQRLDSTLALLIEEFRTQP